MIAMFFKYKLLIISELILICSPVVGQKHFNVIQKSGAVASYELGTVRSISFSSGKANITPYNGSVVSYDILSLSSFDFQTYTPISQPSIHQEKHFEVYPNPIVNEIHIKIHSILGGQLRVRLVDLQSRLIVDQQTVVDNNTSEVVVPVNLPVGVYLCSISCSNHTEYIKLLKY
jgi:Secretion system C-terminal sorting domain